jgi:hypothetical protein
MEALRTKQTMAQRNPKDANEKVQRFAAQVHKSPFANLPSTDMASFDFIKNFSFESLWVLIKVGSDVHLEQIQDESSTVSVLAQAVSILSHSHKQTEHHIQFE